MSQDRGGEVWVRSGVVLADPSRGARAELRRQLVAAIEQAGLVGVERDAAVAAALRARRRGDLPQWLLDLLPGV